MSQLTVLVAVTQLIRGNLCEGSTMSKMNEPVQSHSLNQRTLYPWASRTEVLALISVVFAFLLLVHIANSLESDTPFAQLILMILRLVVMVSLILVQVVSVVCLVRERNAEAKAKDAAASQLSSQMGESRS
jgi:hypothetical protein